jgi:hypothetical protein
MPLGAYPYFIDPAFGILSCNGAIRMEEPFDYGPQHRQDDPFTKRMRFHQSWYRVHVLKAPYGPGPKAGSTSRYGNMLTIEDGEKGLNFLRPHIFEIAKRRIAESRGLVGRFRLLCNMLSSQPYCFNLFGPLVDDGELATYLFKECLPNEVERVDKVRLKYLPEPADEYLNDRTVLDAYVEYTRPDGKKAFIGIETKLAEDFSQKPSSQPSYWRRTKLATSPWPEASWPRLIDQDINQIWRKHLLVETIRNHHSSNWAAGHLMVITHPLDRDYHKTLQAYQDLLKNEVQNFSELPLDRLLNLWDQAVIRQADREWLSQFRRRYLDLSESEPAFHRINQFYK